MYHYRKNRKKFNSYPKTTDCDFCFDPETRGRTIRETKHAFVIPNRTFYDQWELHTVLDHLLIIPKRHVHSLSELTEPEQLDIMKLLAEYEGAEYNVYARATRSPRRSVYHQHTHLIKIDSRQARFSLFIRRPYWLIRL